MKTLIIFILMLTSGATFSKLNEQRYPVVGEPIPSFTLSEVYHFSKKSVSSKELEGKYLILDFWALSCLSCIESFPKINALQVKFKDDIQFMLIGKSDKSSKNIRQVYERVRSVKKLEMAVAYDTALFEQFAVPAVPHVVIVDPQGIVVAVTSSSDLTEKNLEALLMGDKPYFQRAYNRMETNPRDLMTDEDLFCKPGDNFYKSILVPWSLDMPFDVRLTFDDIREGRYSATCMSLERLYLLAYTSLGDWRYGDSIYTRFSMKPILELKNPGPFEYDVDNGKGLYNYYLNMPKNRASKSEKMRVMQHDLDKYFNYGVKIEVRSVPCLKLKLMSNAKERLKIRPASSVSDAPINLTGPTHISLRNATFDELLSVIYNYNNDKLLIDDTGLSNSRIDLEVDAVLTDFPDVEKALKANGLVLVPGSTKLRTLVITDSRTKDTSAAD